MAEDGKKSRIIPWLLVILPVWVFVSAGFALVKYFKDEKADAAKEEQRFARSVSAGSIADDLRKTIEVIGERNTGIPEKLSAMASMIAGSLGPSNTGYEVKPIEGPAGFPILQASVGAKDRDASPVWVLTSYDSPAGSRGAERNATGLAATMAASQALADAEPSHPIRFLFLPHANEADSPIAETALTVANLMKQSPAPKAILCIEAMGDAETLILSSRDTAAIPTREFQGLGKILGAEVTCLGDDFDLSSTLFEMGLPAIRIATRPTLLPDEKDDKIPFAPTVAASAGRLVELLERLSR
ncbi:hypothetical protein HZ994_04000 [Akkermansiaceae bacterium]|nr:hypothetical protein HZ994_04000 [Akkermansiaceae bacterium]